MKKAWHEKINRHVSFWSSKLPGREWWPKYVYFYTDINNAIPILNSGLLYSRKEATRKGLIQLDCASGRIIDNTDDDRKNFVRFYYRPRTPTQYSNEGIRPLDERSYNAHCPVPIFFLFDAYELMSRGDAQYSNISLASPRATYGETEQHFNAIDFKKVFHEGWYDPEHDGHISLHRHAELLIPNEVTISNYVRLITCRSSAERDMFLYMLAKSCNKEVLEAWKPFVKIGNSRLFEKRWAFVESVHANHNSIKFHFNPSSQHRNNFNYKIMFNFDNSGFKEISNALNGKTPFTFTWKNSYTALEIKLFLDDSLAYYNELLIGDILL